MADNKGTKGKGIVAAVVAIGQAAATQAKARGTVQDATVTPVVNKFVAMSVAPTVVKVDNTELPVTNKRALAVAIYLLVCDKLGLKPSNTQANGAAIKLTARLLPYANMGYSRNKQHMLKGSEVTASGMLGYAKFVTKADAAKLMPNGEGYSKTQACTKLAAHIVTSYASIEGIDAIGKAPLASK